MKILVLIVFLVIVIIALFFGFCLLFAIGKIKSLEKAKANLRDDNSKLSNALRRKGIEVDGLERKIRRLEKNV